MYDEKNEAREFIGESAADARAEAASFFGCDEGELRVVELPGADVAGLAGRTAIVALPKNAKRPEPRGDDDDRGGRRERGGRGRDRDRGDRGGRGRDRGDRDGGRGRGERAERGGRGRGRDRDRDGGRDRDRDRDRDGGRDRDDARSLREEGGRDPVESKATKSGELGSLGEYVAGAVERMGLGNFEISQSEEDDFIVFRLTGDAADALGQADGRAIDGLQLLANQAAMRESDDAKRVVIDVEAESERRESFLERLADRAAKRALETGRSVVLDPMNPRDRRLIHVALRDHDEVATVSIGSGRYRQVVVAPEGTDDYEEAKRGGGSQ